MSLTKQPEEKEIFELLQKIFLNIGVQAEIKNFDELTDPDLYMEIFVFMFPFLQDQYQEIVKIPTGEKELKMQFLIDLLADYIQTDLSHIKGKSLFMANQFANILKGKEIVRGQHNHLFNLLQLLFELSRLLTGEQELDVNEL